MAQVRTKRMLENALDRTNRRRLWISRIIFFLFSLLLSLLCGELVLRAFFAKRFSAQAEGALMYRYDETLGWFPKANAYGTVVASRTISVTNNSKGFRGRLPATDGKPGILFIGDSFTWGFDSEDSERFTDKLQAEHPEWNIYNCGVAGYGTDQEYLLLKRCFADYQPKLVVLVFCSDNDDMDNSSNVASGGYYKPYYTINGGLFPNSINGSLILNGVPVPRSERVFYAEHPFLSRSLFLRMFVRAWYKLTAPPPNQATSLLGSVTGSLIKNMQVFVNNKGASFAVAVEGPHQILEDFLGNNGIPFVDLTTFVPSHRYTRFGSHWTPEGQDFVCDKIERFIVDNKFMVPQ